MNKIRKNWKNNGTPFFFHFQSSPSNYIHLDCLTCSKYDSIVIQDDGCTAMDTLVDIHHIDRALESVQDEMVLTQVRETLNNVLNTLNYVVTINSKNDGK